MKRVLFILFLALLSNFEISAQLVREKMVEKDGFVWHKTHIEGTAHYGAEDEKGKTIIPTSKGLTYLRYDCADDSFGAFIVIRNSDYGVFSVAGKEIIPIGKYPSSIILNSDGFFRFEVNGKRGACDLSGKEIIPASRGYDTILHMDKYYHVSRDGKAGACNLSGKELISPDRGYDSIMMREGGYFEVQKNHKRGMCSSSGEELISPDRGYDAILVKDNYITVGRDYKFGACSLDGKELVPPLYSGLYYDDGEFKYLDSRGDIVTVYSPAQASSAIASSAAPAKKTSETEAPSSQSPTRADYVPPTPVFDGYYTLTGVYQSGGQWFSTGIATLTYFRVYEDEMYEGKGTYAYQYTGNERLDNTVFRRYGTNDDSYFLVTYDGLIRWVSAFTANYPMLGTIRTVNVNYYDRGDTRAAYTQSYGGGGSYSGSSSSSSSSSSGAGTHRCGLCDGKGWIPTDEGATSFGSTAEKWCEDCRKFVVTNHWHKPCPSCGGKGVW